MPAIKIRGKGKRFDRSHAPAWERRPGRSCVLFPSTPWAASNSPWLAAIPPKAPVPFPVILVTRERHDPVPTLERGNDRPQKSPLRTGTLAPPGGRFGARRISGDEKQPFGAEPVGGVRNREKGASCLSAASSCPAGSAARRPGSSQRQGCPFFWFFSLGRQRKERHPAGGRWHFGGAGGIGSAFSGWRVGRIRMTADRL